MSLKSRGMRDIEKRAKQILAHEVTNLLRGHFADAKVSYVETNTGAYQILIDKGNGTAYHLTVSKARY